MAIFSTNNQKAEQRKIKIGIKTSSFLFIIILLLLLIAGAIAVVSKVLQNEPGPTRTVIYVPSDSLSCCIWLIIDRLIKPVKDFSACYHTSAMVSIKEKQLCTDAKSAIIGESKKRLFVAALTKSNLYKEDSYDINTKKMRYSLRVSTDDNFIATLFIPFESGQMPTIQTEGNVHTIRMQGRKFVIAVNFKQNKYIQTADISTNAKLMVEITHMNKDGAKGNNADILLIDATEAKIKGMSILTSNKQKQNTQSQVTGIWSCGLWHEAMPLAEAKHMRKAPGLQSVFLNPLGGYQDGNGYDWKCDSLVLDRFYSQRKENMNLLFDDSDFEDIRKGSGTFSTMVQAYRIMSKTLANPLDYDDYERALLTATTAFIARLDSNEAALNWSKSSLATLSKNKGYRVINHRSQELWWFLYAYDMLSPLLSKIDKQHMRKELTGFASDIDKSFFLVNVNNWRVMSSTALGLAGLELQRPDWVSKAVNHLDRYLDFGIKQGVSYEGNSYFSFGFRFVPMFIAFLTRIDSSFINFYKDERYQQLLAVLIAQQSSNQDFPCYEDCDHSDKRDLNEFIAANGMGLKIAADLQNDDKLRKLAAACKFVELNSLPSLEHCWLPDAPLYIGKSLEPFPPSNSYLNRWIPVDTTSSISSFVLGIGGLAILKNGYGNNGETFSISAKGYAQVHTHMDELSIELWAHDKLWLTNPGYTGFGEPNHAWTTSSKASNTLLINDKGQVNQSGAFFREACLTPNLQLVVADGSNLYKHPQRSIVGRMTCFALFIAFFLIIAVIFHFYDTSHPILAKERKCLRNHLLEPTLFSLPFAWSLFHPFPPRKALRAISRIVLSSMQRNFEDVKKAQIFYFLVQACLFGFICSLGCALLFEVIRPFIPIYINRVGYDWIHLVKKLHWIFPAIGFLIGIIFVWLNYVFLDRLIFRSGSLLNISSGLFRQILKLSYADLTSMAVLTVAIVGIIILKAPYIHNAFVMDNFDPWTIQIRLISLASRPIFFVMLLICLKLILQLLSARRCGLFLLYITGKKAWFHRGFLRAIIPMLFKKACWLAICFWLLALIVYSSQFISAEFITGK
jgi:hypothetical protein